VAEAHFAAALALVKQAQDGESLVRRLQESVCCTVAALQP
jgi:hypothetical protein